MHDEHNGKLWTIIYKRNVVHDCCFLMGDNSCFYFVLLVDQITLIDGEMSVQTSRFANVWSEIKEICVIFTHLKLWVAVARHNFKRVKIQLFILALQESLKVLIYAQHAPVKNRNEYCCNIYRTISVNSNYISNTSISCYVHVCVCQYCWFMIYTQLVEAD